MCGPSTAAHYQKLGCKAHHQARSLNQQQLQAAAAAQQQQLLQARSLNQQQLAQAFLLLVETADSCYRSPLQLLQEPTTAATGAHYRLSPH
jgi:hypothetical protein